MKEKGLWGVVCCVATLISALGAINWGLVAMNVNLFDTVPFLMSLKNPLLYVVGLSGLITLIGWVKHVAGGCERA